MWTYVFVSLIVILKNHYSLQMPLTSSLFVKDVESGEAPCLWVRLWLLMCLTGLHHHTTQVGAPFSLTISVWAAWVSRSFRQEVYGGHCRDPHSGIPPEGLVPEKSEVWVYSASGFSAPPRGQETRGNWGTGKAVWFEIAGPGNLCWDCLPSPTGLLSRSKTAGVTSLRNKRDTWGSS